MELLLEADPAATYVPDNEGSFPIHLAASKGHLRNVLALLQKKKDKKKSAPYCAQLRDGKGRTFLHVAVQNKRFNVVYKLRNMLASSVMNMQDDDGNTALHLAVEVGDARMVRSLVSIPEVNLNLTNNKGETPRELASITSCGYLNPWVRIYRLLENVGVWTDYARPQENILPSEIEIQNKEKGLSQNIMDRTQIIGLGSVLVSTVTFAAAFAVPGGYRADGTPTLAGQYAFDAFVMANALAFIFSGGSIVLLMVAGLRTEFVIRMRLNSLLGSELFLACSARCLVAAFAFGMYAVLAPVERAKALLYCSFTGFALLLLEAVWGLNGVIDFYHDKVVLWNRLRTRRAAWNLGLPVLATLMLQFSPYIIIALSGLK
uniref:PGG domain-containing protein n=1 Tax=Hordeum vulgare subsp. vulgare TaxID=112509 RepID=A0A8I6Z039_HORVV